jgi:hypothetical protein
MPEHPLVAAIEVGVQSTDDRQRAREDALAVETLVAEASAITRATTETRTRLRAIVVQVDTLVGPWRVNYPVKGLVDWHEGIRRVLHDRAMLLFGASGELLAPPPTESLRLPMPVRMSGPPSMFGL